MKKIYFFGLMVLMSLLFVACTEKPLNSTIGTTNKPSEPPTETKATNTPSTPFDLKTVQPEIELAEESTIEPSEEPSTEPSEEPSTEPAIGSRSNVPYCLVPSADGIIAYTTSTSSIDVSNANEGYVIANYFGTSEKVKFRITGENGITYTYNLYGGNEVFPLSSGNGLYDLAVYENITGDQYSTAQFETISVSLTNSFGPFLYPNQYVVFNSSSTCVAKAKTLATMANNDLDVVSSIYNYIINNITYDYSKATSIQSGYLPDADSLLVSKTGICLDYASLMVAMLRSQRIPARLEVGYVGEAYHAWISTYIQDIGWVNGMIEFDGVHWKLMDPTFAASTPGEDLENFIGDGSSYLTKYIY